MSPPLKTGRVGLEAEAPGGRSGKVMGRVRRSGPGRVLSGSLLVFWLWVLALATLAAEPEVAARATAILNKVEAISADGVARRLARGDLIYVGETLTTGPKGRAQLRFTDRGVMTLRPATRLSIDDYRYDPAAPALNRQNLSVDLGGFRAATGAVADSNREGYRVASPLGVVGVRGTNYEAVLTPSNNLVLGAYEGTIDVTSPTGNVAVLGEGADFNFARVDSSGGVEYLLEPPEELASSAGVTDDQEEAEESEEEAEESEESEESEEAEEDSESTEDEGDSGEEEADEGEAADEESADASEDGEAEDSAESAETDGSSAEESEEAAAEESDEGAGESGEAEESGADGSGSDEGGAAEADAEAEGGGDADGAAEPADSGDGEAAPPETSDASDSDGAPAETADSSGDSKAEAESAPAASDSADAEPAAVAETSEAPAATTEDSSAGAPEAASTEAAAPEPAPAETTAEVAAVETSSTEANASAPVSSTESASVTATTTTVAAEPAAPALDAGGDLGGLDAGLTATTETTVTVASPTPSAATSTTPDASTLASATVDPASRGALPPDQDEPDQAGSIENLIDTDGDGIGDAADLDDDGDGVADTLDPEPFNALVSQLFSVFTAEEQTLLETGEQSALLVTGEGLKEGVSAKNESQQPLFAGDAPGAAEPAATRGDRLQQATVLVNGASVDTVQAIEDPRIARVPGLEWTRLQGPVTVFETLGDDRDFRMLSQDLLLATGAVKDLAVLQGPLRLTFGGVTIDAAGAATFLGDGSGPEVVLSSDALAFEALFGAADLNVTSGEMTGVLDVVLADALASSEEAFPRYLAPFAAQISEGRLTAVTTETAEYLLTDSPTTVIDDSTGVIVSARFPAIAELAGFLTGDSAEYLQLAFGFKTTERIDAEIRGLALLKSYALTEAERAALSTGRFFVGATCCELEGVALLAGAASDPAVAPLLAVMVDGNGDPLNPEVPGFASLDPAAADQALYLFRPNSAEFVTPLALPALPGTDNLLAQRWERPLEAPEGPSIDVFFADSGALVSDADLPSTLFAFSGVPSLPASLVGRATYDGTVLVDALVSGFEPSATQASAVDPFAGFSVSFDIDFASGEVTRGRLLFGTETDFLSEVLFSGQVITGAEGSAAVMTLEPGLLFGQPLDPQGSSLGGFFAGQGGEAFAGAFNLSTGDLLSPIVAAGLFVNTKGPLDPLAQSFTPGQQARLLAATDVALTTPLALDQTGAALRFGLGLRDPLDPLIALGLYADPLAPVVSSREAVLGESTALIAGSRSGGVTVLAQTPGDIPGLDWYRWPAPVRVFSELAFSDRFTDVDRALLVAVGTPSTFADLTATTKLLYNVPSTYLIPQSELLLLEPSVSFSATDPSLTSTFGFEFGPQLGAAAAFEIESQGGLTPEQAYGYGVLNLQQGDFQGGLELVLRNSADSVESRYLGLFNAPVQNGVFPVTGFSDAVYVAELPNSDPSSILLNAGIAAEQLSGGSPDLASRLASLSLTSAPAFGELAGFFTGASASALQLSFTLDSTASEGLGVDGLALFRSPLLTAGERELLATDKRGYVALQCCSGHGAIIGRAYAGVAPEDFLLASVFSLGNEPSVQPGDPGFWYDPFDPSVEAGIFRFAGGSAEAIALPETLGSDISGAEWRSVPPEGGSAVLVDANAGALLSSTQDLLFLTATPTVLFPTETAERTFTADVILSGLSFDIQTFEAPITNLAGTALDLTFNVDLATGAIPYGRLAFSLPNDGGDVRGRFSGQVLFDTDYQYLDVSFRDGVLAGAPLDLVESELQGFFSGQNAEAFVGGFSLLADLFSNAPFTTPELGSDTLAEGLFVALAGPRADAGPLLDAEKLQLASTDRQFLALDTGFLANQGPEQRFGVVVDETIAIADSPRLFLGTDPLSPGLPFTGDLGIDTEIVRIADRPSTVVQLLSVSGVKAYFFEAPHDFRAYGAQLGDKRKRFEDYLLVTTFPSALGAALGSGHLYYRSDELSFQVRAAQDPSFAVGGAGEMSFALNWNTGALSQGRLSLPTDNPGDGLTVFFSGTVGNQGGSVATNLTFEDGGFFDANDVIYQRPVESTVDALLDPSASILSLVNRDDGQGGADFLSAFELVVRNGSDAILGDLLFAGLGRVQAQNLSLNAAELGGLAFGQGDPLWGFVALACCELPGGTVNLDPLNPGGFLIQGISTDDGVDDPVLVVPTANGQPLPVSDLSFYGSNTIEQFYRRGDAAFEALTLDGNPALNGPGDTALEVGAWGATTPFVAKPLLVDSTGALIDPPAPVQSLLFQRAPLAALPFSGPKPYGTFAGQLDLGSLGFLPLGDSSIENAWFSFNVDYFTGIVSEGRLSLSLVDPGLPSGTAVVDLGFSGLLPAQSDSSLPQGFASLSIDEVFSTAPAPFSGGQSELQGFFTGTELGGFEFRGGAGLLSDDGGSLSPLLFALLSARADTGDPAVRLEQRLTNFDWARWTGTAISASQTLGDNPRFGLALFPLITFEQPDAQSVGTFVQRNYETGGVQRPGYAPALEGLLLGRGSNIDEFLSSSAFVLGANAQIDRGNGAGIERPDFLQQPFDVVLRGSGTGTAVQTLPVDVSGDFDVDWGIWDAALAQDAPQDPNLGPIIDQVLYASGVPTPTANLPVTGTVAYQTASVSEALFARYGELGTGGFGPSAPVALAMNTVNIGFTLDFQTGLISGGTLNLAYDDPGATAQGQLLTWQGTFDGQTRGALAQFNLLDLTVTRDATLEAMTADLSRSAMAGFVTGAAAERFLGGADP